MVRPFKGQVNSALFNINVIFFTKVVDNIIPSSVRIRPLVVIQTLPWSSSSNLKEGPPSLLMGRTTYPFS